MAKDELVSTAEVAEILGISKQLVVMWRHRKPDFPQPRVVLAMGPIWNRKDILAWHMLRNTK